MNRRALGVLTAGKIVSQSHNTTAMGRSYGSPAESKVLILAATSSQLFESISVALAYVWGMPHQELV